MARRHRSVRSIPSSGQNRRRPQAVTAPLQCVTYGRVHPRPDDSNLWSPEPRMVHGAPAPLPTDEGHRILSGGRQTGPFVQELTSHRASRDAQQ